MSTGSDCRIHPFTRKTLCSACLAGAFLAAAPLPAARAEGDGTAALVPQYASLPGPERMKDADVTGSLPRTGADPAAPLFSGSVANGRIVLRKGAPTGCLPAALREVVADLSVRFGTVSIESTHRSAGRNRRAGGAGHSLHLACRAMDLRIHNRQRGVMAYLRSRPEIGGLKIYRNGIIHIDNGSRRSW
jgi:Uncharacterized protein conserved in bacteria